MKEYLSDTAAKLAEIDDEVWDAHGFRSRPSGEERRGYLEDAVALIRKKVNESKITEDVVLELENENRHSLLDAIDVALGRTSVEDLMEKEMGV